MSEPKPVSPVYHGIIVEEYPWIAFSPNPKFKSAHVPKSVLKALADLIGSDSPAQEIADMCGSEGHAGTT